MMNNIDEPENQENVIKNYQEIEIENFDDVLCEYENILRGVYDYGFTEISKVQSKSLQPIIDNVNTIVQSPAGTGKTGAYLIAGLTKIEVAHKYPQLLIIGDTRELANQIYEVSKHIAVHMGINICLCVGGSNSMQNLEQARTSHLLIGTTGRLNDLIARDLRKHSKTKLLDRLKLVVFDEADKLLDGNFVEDTYTVIKNILPSCQICLFSATYSRRILEMTPKFMPNAVKIDIKKDNLSVDLIKNYYVDVEYNEYKYDVIVDIYQRISICQAIIFVNSIKTANELENRLTADGHSVGLIHAELEDKDRIDTLKKFRLGCKRILVATDIIARGIDIQSVGLVVNYDVPAKPDSYVHRVGRGGRSHKTDKPGVAITMVTNQEVDFKRMSNITRIFKVKFISLPALENVNDYLLGKNGYSFSGNTI
jgi:translation initiation factor 4A